MSTGRCSTSSKSRSCAATARPRWRRPGSIVLTESEAMRRFGTIDAVGRTLTLVAGGQTTDYRITGVVRDPPRNSHLALSIVARVDFEALYGAASRRSSPSGCRRTAGSMPGSGPAPTSPRSPGRCRPGSGATSPTRCVGGERTNPGTNVDWRLVNVRDIHLGEAQDSGDAARQRPRARSPRWRWSALLILAMAVVNFVNLATARAGQRAREVALQEGARRLAAAADRPVPRRILLLVTALAMLLALALVEALLPFAQRLPRCRHARSPISARDGLLLPACAAGRSSSAALGGLYPAFVPLALPAGARCSRPTSRPPTRRAPGGFATPSSSASSRCRSGSSSAPRSSTPRPHYARTVDPGYRRDGMLQIGNIYRGALLPVLEHPAARDRPGRRRRLGRPLDHRRRHLGHGEYDRDRAGSGRERRVRALPGRSRLLPDDGHPDRSPGAPSSRARRWTTAPCPTADDEAVAAMARRGYNVVVNDARRAAARLQPTRARRSAGPCSPTTATSRRSGEPRSRSSASSRTAASARSAIPSRR